MNKKNIALIIPQMRHGGAERFVSRLSGLLKDKYNVTVILFDDRDMTYDITCKKICLNVYPREHASFFIRVVNSLQRIYKLKFIKKELKINTSISFGDSANIVNALSKGKEKVVLSIRGYQRLENMKKGFNKIFNNFLFGRSDKIICVSKVMLATFNEYFPKYKKKAALLYNPYNINEILSLSEKKINLYQEMFDKNKVFISVGTYKKEKGYWHLIKAFYLLRQNYGDIKLFIIGKNSGNYKERLKQLACDLGIENDIVLEEFDSNPFKYIKRSFLFILPSISEGFPNSLVEAMACGIPVIASDCKTGPREILSEGEFFLVSDEVDECDYGVLVSPSESVPQFDSTVLEKSDINLYNGMTKFMKSKELASEYGKKAKKRAEFFSYKECENEIINIIESLR